MFREAKQPLQRDPGHCRIEASHSKWSLPEQPSRLFFSGHEPYDGLRMGHLRSIPAPGLHGHDPGPDVMSEVTLLAVLVVVVVVK